MPACALYSSYLSVIVLPCSHLSELDENQKLPIFEGSTNELKTSLTSTIPMIKTPMLIIGAVYMLYLAWKTLKSSSDIGENHSKSGFFSGFALQFINPKIYIYCIISMEAYILPSFNENVMALFFFAVLLAFIGFVFTLCWSLFGSLIKIIFLKYAKITNTFLALLLVYCAISLFIE